MNITSDYNLYKYNSLPYGTNKPQSFGAAGDITLKYVLNNRLYMIPERMQKLVKQLVAKGREDITLRDLHLKTYAGLLKCKTLDEARNMYPEFREVLPAKAVLKNHTKNIKRIEEVVSLEDLSLYLLQARWGKLKNIQEIIEDFGLKGRFSIGWTIDKLQIPKFPTNYQTLLNSSDEARNEIIASKTRAFNAKHRDWVVERNTKLAQDPRNRELNRELMQVYWDRKGDAKADMSSLRAENPSMELGLFDKTFWDAYPEHKRSMSSIRREFASERRIARKNNKN